MTKCVVGVCRRGAQKWIAAFDLADLITAEDWTSPSKNKSKVWRLVAGKQDDEGDD